MDQEKERDELTLEERQTWFEEMLKDKAAREEQLAALEDKLSPEVKAQVPALVSLLDQLKIASAQEASGVMRQVDILSGHEVGAMIRNSFEALMQQVIMTKQLLLYVAIQEGAIVNDVSKENAPTAELPNINPSGRVD